KQVDRRVNADACAACQCGEAGVAIAYTDGNLVAYEGDELLSARHTVSSGVVRGAIGWDRGSIVWVAEEEGFKAWRPGTQAPLAVRDGEVFGGRLQVVPTQWIARPEGATLLVTSHSVMAYRLEHAESEASFHIDGVLGGPVWRAVDRRGRDWW